MHERELAPGMVRVYFHRRLDNPARIEWEYRREGISLLRYMICPVMGDSARLLCKRGVSQESLEQFQKVLAEHTTDRWFFADGWVVDLPENIVHAIDVCLDDILAEYTENELEQEAQDAAWFGQGGSELGNE